MNTFNNVQEIGQRIRLTDAEALEFIEYDGLDQALLLD